MGFLVILLLFLPAVGAVVVACLGQERALLARQISLGVTVAGAVVAVILAIAFMANREESKDPRTYAPSFVPGSTTAAPGKVGGVHESALGATDSCRALARSE